MFRKSILLAAAMLFGAFLITGASDANSKGGTPLKQVRFQVISGLVNGTHPGHEVSYEFLVANLGRTTLANLRFNIILPQQTIDKGTARLYPAPGDVVSSRIVRPEGMTPYALPAACSSGVHLCWTLRRLSPRGGPDILVHTHVVRGGKGAVCDKLELTFAGRVYDYSPSCVKLG